ncbi:MAG: signal peptidase I [Planctomycetota bacterium]|jgi:signal peptidase I
MNKKHLKKYLKKTFKEWRLTLFFIFFVIIPVKSAIADFNWVPTGSMNPTIREGDLVFVNKIAYDLRIPLTMYRLVQWADPQPGDIVICFSPDNNIRLVKRIIGLPSDTIEMKNAQLFINNRPVSYSKMDSNFSDQLTEKEQKQALLTLENLSNHPHPVMIFPSINGAKRNFQPITIPKNHYFVLGDNRDFSKDSRIFGFVERKAIVGKAKAVIVSFDITDKYQPRLKRFLKIIN